MEAIKETGAETLYLDGGFVSGDIIEKAAGHGLTLRYTNMEVTGKGEYFGAADFTFNEALGCIDRCPGGCTPFSAIHNKASIESRFDMKQCLACPHRHRCPGKQKDGAITIKFGINEMKLNNHRADTKVNAKEIISYRAAIEGTNSALKRTGLGKLKVRGIVKSTVTCGLKILGQNIKRFIRYKQGLYETKCTGPLPGLG
jgi:hypothetical protein